VRRGTFGLIAALVASLLLLVWSISWTLADRIFILALDALHDTEISPYNVPPSRCDKALPPLEERQLQRSLELVSLSSRLNPLEPSAWLVRAGLSDQLCNSDGLTRDSANNRFGVSENYRAHAMRLRPHSAYFWQFYAQHGFDSGLAAREVIARMDTAVRLAPYRPYVREAELRIGFSLWDRLNETQRERLFTSISDLERHGLRFVIEAALVDDRQPDRPPVLSAAQYRVVLGFALWERLDPAARTEFRSAIVEAMQAEPRFVTEAARASGRSTDLRSMLEPRDGAHGHNPPATVNVQSGADRT